MQEELYRLSTKASNEENSEFTFGAKNGYSSDNESKFSFGEKPSPKKVYPIGIENEPNEITKKLKNEILRPFI